MKESSKKKNSLEIAGAESDEDLKGSESLEQEKSASQLSAEALEYSVVADKEPNPVVSKGKSNLDVKGKIVEQKPDEDKALNTLSDIHTESEVVILEKIPEIKPNVVLENISSKKPIQNTIEKALPSIKQKKTAIKPHLPALKLPKKANTYTIA